MKVTLDPIVYRKLIHLCTKFDTEVGAWGIAADKNNPLHITDCDLTEQISTTAEIDWDSDDIVAFRRHCAEKRKLHPDQFTHVALHTHPGFSADPSSTDWEHLKSQLMFHLVCDYKAGRAAGLKKLKPPWICMVIISKKGEMSAHIMYLMIHNGIEALLSSKIGVEVAWTTGNQRNAWEAEYQAKVRDPLPETNLPFGHPAGIHDPSGSTTTSPRSRGRVYDSEDDWKTISEEIRRERELLANIDQQKRGSGRHGPTHERSLADDEPTADISPEDDLDVEDLVDIAESAQEVRIDPAWDFLDLDVWEKNKNDITFCKHVILTGGAQFNITQEEQLKDSTESEIQEYAWIIRTCLADAIVDKNEVPLSETKD